jgi:hypothetical protein
MNFEPGIIKTVASHLLGEPNIQQSNETEVRYGTNGSLAISVQENTFFDHEAKEGGGILDLVCLKAGISTKSEAVEWLKKHGIDIGEAPDKVQSKVVATYDYKDESGTLIFQVQRFEPKAFRQRRPDGDGWIYKVKGVRQIPYRLPELLSKPDQMVFVVEGEKDADRLATIDLIGTCNAGGSGKWRAIHAEHLKGRAVCVIPDNDQAGLDHAAKVAKSLRGIASSVSILDLPSLPEKGDVSDWLNAGGTRQELLDLAAAAPVAPSGRAKKQAADDDSEEEVKRSQTDMLVQFAKGHFDLLHDKNGDVFAMDNRTKEVRRLGGRQFKDRLIAGFYAKTQMAVRDQSLRESLGTLQALGRFNGEPQDIHVRVAKHGEKYFIDLCEPGNSRAIELGAGYWKTIDCPPVLFVRGDAQQPLPAPQTGGNLAALWRIANVPQQHRLLVVTWLIDCLRPDTPYPGLELIGEQGSGKSTAAEALRRVIDPNACNLRGAPKTVEDIFVAAKQNHVVAYENISHLPGPMQDALAILSTGGGYSKRMLYSNDDEHIISVRRPWLINGIAISVTQQDLVDRVISIDCPVIEIRQSSSQQWRKFNQAMPGIFGGLLDTAAKALEILPTIKLAPKDRPRLVEFVMLGQAVALSAGYKTNEFLERFTELRAETVARTLDSSPVATAIIEMLEVSPTGITAPIKDILIRLEHHKPFGAEAWPRSPKGLGDALRRAAPALRQMGISCISVGKLHGGVINWSIQKKTADPKSPMSPKSPDSTFTDVDAGTWGTWGTLGNSETLTENADLEAF